MPHENETDLKVVGASGQISLGKRYAGKALRMETHDDGTILLTPVAMVPETQLWTLEEPHRSQIGRGLVWAKGHAPAETDLDALARKAKTKANASTPRRRGRR